MNLHTARTYRYVGEAVKWKLRKITAAILFVDVRMGF